MEIYELVIEMKLLERRLTLYEEKYGVLSEDFYKALFLGSLARFDEYDESDDGSLESDDSDLGSKKL